MPERTKWIGDRVGVGIGEEDDELKGEVLSDHFLTVSTQGKTVEFPIPEGLFEEIDEEFEEIRPLDP